MIRRRRSLGFSKIIFFSVPLIFILFAFLIFRSGFFNIKGIEIRGDKIICADNDQLKNTSGISGQNFFLLNNVKIREALKEKYICIKNVSLNRLIPDKVKLGFVARRPSAILLKVQDKLASPSSLIENVATPEATVQDSFAVDSEGVIFSQNINKSDIPKIYIYNSDIAVGKKLENTFINSSLDILDKIKTFGVIVKKSWIVEDFFIINPDTSDPKIIFRLNDQINVQTASLQLILTEAKIDLRELKFIDLRFDKPVVRFAPFVK